MARLNPDCLRLYLVTDRSLSLGRTLSDVVAAAVQGGVTCVQLREKDASTQDFYAQAMLLKELLQPLGIPLIINDRIDVALACKAEGVHLGQIDMPVQVARQLLPADIFIGWSVESMEDVLRSAHLPLDYLGVSPVFDTSTKKDIHQPWGLDGLRAVRAQSGLPLVAIGGIHPHNASDVVRAGAHGLAVVSAICSADNPTVAAQTLKQRMQDAIHLHGAPS